MSKDAANCGRSGVGVSAGKVRPATVGDEEQERIDAVLVREWFHDEAATIREIEIRMLNASEEFRRLHPIARDADWIRAVVSYRKFATAEWETKR